MYVELMDGTTSSRPPRWRTCNITNFAAAVRDFDGFGFGFSLGTDRDTRAPPARRIGWPQSQGRWFSPRQSLIVSFLEFLATFSTSTASTVPLFLFFFSFRSFRSFRFLLLTSAAVCWNVGKGTRETAGQSRNAVFDWRDFLTIWLAGFMLSSCLLMFAKLS